MATYDNLTDIPTFTPRGPGNRGTPYFTYKGKKYNESSFRAQFPQQYTDYQNATGGKGAVPAGQPGSPYPSALPANSFEQAIAEAKAESAKAEQENEKRYQQLLDNAKNKWQMADRFYAGINEKSEEDYKLLEGNLTQTYAQLAAGYDQSRAEIENVGQLAKIENERNYKSANAQTSADAVRRGIYSTSVVDSLQNRNREQRDRALMGINESIAQLRSGVVERGTQAKAQMGYQNAATLSDARNRSIGYKAQEFGAKYQALSDRAGVIERRSDNAPSAFDIANLISQREYGKSVEKAAKKSQNLDIFKTIIGGAATIGAIACDRRLKTNITQIPSAMAQDHSLKVYEFEYTPDAISSGRGSPGFHIGVMAQEVLKTHPQWVDQDDDGYLYITSEGVTKLSQITGFTIGPRPDMVSKE